MRVTRTLSRLSAALAVAALLTGSTSLRAQIAGSVQVKENLDLPYDALGVTEEDEEAPEVIIFYGQNYEGDGIFYALDRSSSTRDGELRIEQREVTRNIMEFSSRVQFGIAFYDGGLMKHPSSGRPAEANAGAKSAAISWLQSIQAGRGTCPGLALMECLNYANFSTAKRNVIIWIGDGCTTCPGHNADQYGQQTLASVKSRNFKRVQINAICVGPPSGVCEGFPKALASQNSGSYTRITR